MSSALGLDPNAPLYSSKGSVLLGMSFVGGNLICFGCIVGGGRRDQGIDDRKRGNKDMNLPDHLSPDLQALVSRRKENNALLLQ